MGSAIGRVLAEGGARVVATLAGRGERTARLAGAAGVECLDGLDAVVTESDVVLSVAPPERAESIADDIAAAASRTGGSPLVADLNAVSPATARRIASRLAAAGLGFVDASISGPPPRAGTTRIYVSGSDAHRLLAIPFPGVELIAVGDEIGAASAVKMCTASVYKGTVALLAQALLTARAHGVVGFVVEDLSSGIPDVAGHAPTSLARAATKSARYVGEMRQIAETQGAAGLTPELFEAMAAVYAALAATPLARRDPEDVDADLPLDAVLDSLS